MNLQDVIIRDTLANRPAATSVPIGTIFFDTTNSILYRSNGTTWQSIEGVSAASLTVKEVDGSPSVSGVTTIRVSNGTLTDDGGGQVTVTTGGGSGTSGLTLIEKKLITVNA